MRYVLVALAVTLSLSSVRAQQPQQPSLMPEGTASISGQVIAADTRKPIAGAVVEIVIYNNISNRFRQVTTDTEGKFEFAKLPAGQYQVAAQATRYIRLQYGQQQAGPVGMLNPARTIELAENQKFTTADFALPGYNAIEGRVVDEFGDPVPNVAIQVSQLQYAAGRRRLMPSNSSGGPTDDLGRFRISGLMPGDYYVEALSGAFADPNAAGGFAVTFYPGTSKASAAQVVTVSAGHDAIGLSFALEPAPGALVSGTVLDGDGRPIEGGTLMLMPSETTGAALFMVVRNTMGPGGRFTFRNVPPGVYTLQAFAPPPAGAGNLGAAAFGYQTFKVDGRDLESLVVRVPASRTLRGRITFDGDMSKLPKPGDIQIATRPIDFESSPVGGGPAPVTIRDDWTFEVSAMSGVRLVVVINRQGWVLKRVLLGGQDVTDTPLDFREHDVNGVELALTTRVSTVTGSLVDAADKPLVDYSIIVFADDEAKWTTWSRYVTVVRTGPAGAFTLRGLPAGTYLAVGVASTINGEWQDPEYLKKLRASAGVARFALADEGSATVRVVVRK
jgi:protocatechuate 3,4-dioxygenase beta subunit